MKPIKSFYLDKVLINSMQNKFLGFPDNIMPIFKGINSFKDSEHARKASVFLPLCNRHNVASVLFTRRSENVGTHKGHVSFPGGHIDPDETVIDAALREVYEELGLKIGNMQVLGIGQRVPAVTGTLVTPVIGFLENDVLDFDHFHPSDHEIDEVFTVPLHTLLDPSYRKTEMLTRRLPNDKIDTNIYPSSSNINSYNADTPMEFPYFGDVQSPQRIWGLTGYILDVVLRDIIRPIITEQDGIHLQPPF